MLQEEQVEAHTCLEKGHSIHKWITDSELTKNNWKILGKLKRQLTKLSQQRILFSNANQTNILTL